MRGLKANIHQKLDNEAIKVKQYINGICFSCQMLANCCRPSIFWPILQTSHCTFSFLERKYREAMWVQIPFQISTFPAASLLFLWLVQSLSLCKWPRYGVLWSRMLASACKTACILLQLGNPSCIIKWKKRHRKYTHFSISSQPLITQHVYTLRTFLYGLKHKAFQCPLKLIGARQPTSMQ